MAKNKISEWSSTPANNTDVGGIDIAEGCAPSGVNNAIREMMAQVKDMQTGADGDNFTVGNNLSVLNDSVFTGTVLVGETLTSTGVITGTAGFSGNLTGNVTGNVSGTSANVTGTVAVANGGTGLTTLTANNVILGNGTSTPTFVAPSTAGNVLTSNGTSWVSGAAGIGSNQTWQNVTSSRVAGVTYTNTTGRPIGVSIRRQFEGGGSETSLTISGVNVATSSFAATASSGLGFAVFGIVPNGETYSMSSSGTVAAWFELR